MELKTKELVYLIVLAVSIASLGVCSSLKRRVVPEKPSPADETLMITVHVAGSVKEPGVYTLPAGSRIEDAIAACGGALAEADVHRLNLAEILLDGKKVFVPTVAAAGEEGEGPLVNINTADSQRLQTLPGIGPGKAEKIIRYREEHGPFSSLEELTKVDTIGPKTFDSIKDLITY